MHEIDNLISTSLRCIDCSGLELWKKRNLICGLLDFLEPFGNGRPSSGVIDILERNHCMVRLSLEAYPGISQVLSSITRLAEQGKSIRLSGDCSIESRTVGKQAFLCCRSGGQVWEKLRLGPFMSPEQAAPIEPLSGPCVILSIVRIAHEQGDDECAAEWFFFVVMFLFGLGSGKNSKGLMAEGVEFAATLAELLCRESVYAVLNRNPGFHDMSVAMIDFASKAARLLLDPYLAWMRKQSVTVQDILCRLSYGAYFSSNPCEGLDLAKKGLALEPKNVKLLFYQAALGIRAASLTGTPDIPALMDWADQLTALLPELTEQYYVMAALNHLAFARELCGQFDLAWEALQELQNRFPESLGFDTVHRLGSLHLRMEKDDS